MLDRRYQPQNPHVCFLWHEFLKQRFEGTYHAKDCRLHLRKLAVCELTRNAAWSSDNLKTAIHPHLIVPMAFHNLTDHINARVGLFFTPYDTEPLRDRLTHWRVLITSCTDYDFSEGWKAWLSAQVRCAYALLLLRGSRGYSAFISLKPQFLRSRSGLSR